jgi:hypothetical protein
VKTDSQRCMYRTIIPFQMQSIIQEHLTKNAIGGAHGSHHVYWVPLKVFNTLPIASWKHNRPPDVVRITEIHEFMKGSKRMDGMIYLACINHQLVCYESNHRREALKGLTEVADILVDVIWNATDDMVKQEFLRLNKSVSVPELYINEEEVPRAVMSAAIDAFCTNYKSLRSPSSHPQRPNFNRDKLTDEFYRVTKELHIGVDELMARLTRLNQVMASRDRRKLSPKVIEKCELAGLWLFAWSATLNIKELE